MMILVASLAFGEEPGLVAHWDFDEGKGEVLGDRGGNGNHAAVRGPKWVKSGQGCALRFDGVDDYVDCGNAPSLDITGPITLAAWVFPEESPRGELGVIGKTYSSFVLNYYTDGKAYWYVGSGGNKAAGRLTVGVWQHVAGTFDGKTVKLYLNGKLASSGPSRFEKIPRGKNFLMGAMVGDPAARDPADPRLAHFEGMLDEVRVYDRALSGREIVVGYNRQAEQKGLSALDVTWFDRLVLTPYHYPERNKLVIEANYRGLLPLPTEAAMRVELISTPGGRVVRGLPVATRADPPRSDVEFDLGGLDKGRYDVRVVLESGGKVRAEATTPVVVPPPAPDVPGPDALVVAPLRPRPAPVACRLEQWAGGGFGIEACGNTYPIVSGYSFPHGGENRLSADASTDRTGEKSWHVSTEKIGENQYRAAAGGEFYTIDRTIALRENRVVVRDTITNRRTEDVGIVIRHRVEAPGAHFNVTRLGGHDGWGERDANHNPTAFIGREGFGIGVMALDDVTVSQARAYRDKKGVGIVNRMFGLRGGASHTIEWAVYPVGSGDYFDFINVVRDELGVSGRTVEGGFTFNDVPTRRSTVISSEMVDLLSLKYLSLPCMMAATDDPEVSIEGFEFMDFPKEIKLLTDTMAKTRREHPGLRVMFHVAHSLYATDTPERFKDSRLIYKDGKHGLWSDDRDYMSRYFSGKRLDEGWNWYYYYPTLDNTYGRTMMKSVDVMMDEMGATGVFCDGFMTHYGGKYTYDRWDGHTVAIDPETKTVQRKLGSLNLLCQDAYIAYCRKIVDKGGVVISDRGPGTLTFLKEAPVEAYVIEGHTIGPQGHLTPVPMCLGAAFPKEQRGMSEAHVRVLRAGCLYAHYYGPFERPNAISFVYPFTVQSIHEGVIRGESKVVTCKSGAYGWPNDRDLHFVYFCDGRGFMAPHAFPTIVDASGVRTKMTLGGIETAVLKKIPVTLDVDRPVNAIVGQYDAAAIAILVNGRGRASISIRDGDFRVRPGSAYRILGDNPAIVTAGGDGTIHCAVDLDGRTRLRVEPARP